jgi:hypothetical protein
VGKSFQKDGSSSELAPLLWSSRSGLTLRHANEPHLPKIITRPQIFFFSSHSLLFAGYLYTFTLLILLPPVLPMTRSCLKTDTKSGRIVRVDAGFMPAE